jgi:hypothetical protein
MSRALIIIGHERQFDEKARSYDHYLRKRAGIRNVTILPGWNRTDDTLLFVIAHRGLLAGRQPFLLVYMGHGDKAGWGYGMHDPKTWLELPYRKIADTLAVTRRGPTLIVNDCCRADGLVEAIIDRINDDSQYGVISACAKDGVAHGHLAEDVLASWEQGQPYQPRVRRVGRKTVVERRFGPELDRYFFPKP